jgi:two-component system response regulator HydG
MCRKKKILVVDDDIAHRTMLRIILSWEYEISEADDGSSAIEKIQHYPPDLVLMDIRMPKISGLEALDRINTAHAEIPVIMMTAYASDTVAEKALNSGAACFLKKPLDFDLLRKTIRQTIRP